MMNEEHRQMLGPKPTKHHPAPWREGEYFPGAWAVNDANGNQVAEVHEAGLVDVIVTAVNLYAAGSSSSLARGSSPVLRWLNREAAHMGMPFEENDASSTMALLKEISRRLSVYANDHQPD